LGALVFYSPWRDDPRRLRGLLLGAHAFLNVARYLAGALARDGLSETRRADLMSSVARRASQVREALRALSFYGAPTELGRRFIGGLWAELGRLERRVLEFPPALAAEQRELS